MTDAVFPVAFLDASVLYPALLRNILMHLSLHGLFRAHWSARVHEEWITALLRNRPDLDRARIEQTRKLMDTHILNALVEDYEHRIDTLTLPDANDRHVLAAAIQCGASLIVTANLRDFPASVLDRHGIAAIHPDAFLLILLDNYKSVVIDALRQLRASYRNPPKTAAELLALMDKQDMSGSAAALNPHTDDL